MRRRARSWSSEVPQPGRAGRRRDFTIVLYRSGINIGSLGSWRGIARLVPYREKVGLTKRLVGAWKEVNPALIIVRVIDVLRRGQSTDGWGV